jgi:hypothetical protein
MSWSYGSWIYNYLCNQCLSPLTLWVRTSFRRRLLDATLCNKVCQWLAAGWWFSPGSPVSSTNKTDLHDITEILLKLMLSTINQTKPNLFQFLFLFSLHQRKPVIHKYYLDYYPTYICLVNLKHWLLTAGTRLNIPVRVLRNSRYR